MNHPPAFPGSDPCQSVKSVGDKFGLVFDIQRAALHDGPGLRTVVFLKGCPLRCAWCHNPESQKLAPETGLSGKTYGHNMTLDEVMDIVRADRAYYEASSGGLTISGGEPTVQYDFCRALLAAAKAEGIETCLDTCGHCPTDNLLALAPLVDVWHYDYKATGNDLHSDFTGADSELIRHNLDALHALGARIRLRCPIVTGVNDTPEHLAAIESFSRADPPFETIEQIPYHTAGNSKYADLARSTPSFQAA